MSRQLSVVICQLQSGQPWFSFINDFRIEFTGCSFSIYRHPTLASAVCHFSFMLISEIRGSSTCFSSVFFCLMCIIWKIAVPKKYKKIQLNLSSGFPCLRFSPLMQNSKNGYFYWIVNEVYRKGKSIYKRPSDSILENYLIHMRITLYRCELGIDTPNKLFPQARGLIFIS